MPFIAIITDSSKVCSVKCYGEGVSISPQNLPSLFAAANALLRNGSDHRNFAAIALLKDVAKNTKSLIKLFHSREGSTRTCRVFHPSGKVDDLRPAKDVYNVGLNLPHRYYSVVSGDRSYSICGFGIVSDSKASLRCVSETIIPFGVDAYVDVDVDAGTGTVAVDADAVDAGTGASISPVTGLAPIPGC